LTSATPNATSMKIETSTRIVNHHSARVRSDGHQCAPSAHRPASAFPMMTNHAKPRWI
jgi:hypothetical protein